mmetsp:Transcript_32952/g.90900  ORF Transcript_32952/g.90900 Transcript_32952/m.90900 type:complete len:609 (-) Transcript_32952:9-1835(-)
MQWETVFARGFMAFVVLTVGTYFAAMLRYSLPVLLHRSDRRAKWAACHQTWKAARLKLAQSWHPLSRLLRCGLEDDVDPLELAARNLAESMRLRRIRSYVNAMVHVLAIFVILTLYMERETEDVASIYKGSIYLPTVLTFMTTLVFWLAPTQLTLRRIDVLHLLTSYWFLWSAAVSCHAATMRRNSSIFTTTRLVLSLVLGNATFTVAINFFYCVGVSLIYMQCSDDEALRRAMGSDHAEAFVRHEVVNLLMIAVCVCVVEVRTKAQVRATLEAKASATGETTLKSLLSVLCDAVVHLGPDLRTLTPSPQLAALLLRQDPNTISFCFTDLIDEADRRRFKEQVQEAAKIGRPTQSLSVHMLGGNQTRVAIRLFFACFADINDRWNYMVGLQEIGCEETNSIRNVDDSLYLSADAALVSEYARAAGTADAGGPEAQSQSDRSVSSCSGDLLPVEDTAGVSLETAVWFDCLHAALPILNCTPGFTHISGPCPAGQSLLDFLVGSGTRFLAFVQERLNAISNGSSLAGSVDFGPVILRSPIAKLACVEYLAMCVLIFRPVPDDGFEDNEDPPLVVCAAFRQLSQRRRRPRKSRARAATNSRVTPRSSLRWL